MDRFLLVFLSIACFSKSFTQTPANLDLSFRLTSKTLGYINGFSCQKHGKSIVTSDVAANYGNNKSWHIVRLDTSGQFYSTFDFASYSNLATSYAFPNTMFTPLTKVLAARCSNTPANMSGYYFKPNKTSRI